MNRMVNIIIFLFFGLSSLYAQNNYSDQVLQQLGNKKIPKSMLNKISIQLDNVSLEEAISIISEKSRMKLNYSQHLINPLNTVVSIHESDIYAVEALLAVLNTSGSTLKITQNGQVAITPKEQTNNTRVGGLKGTVKGKIIESKTGESLPGANIIVKKTSIGTASDIEGNYTLKIPPGTYTLVVTYIGYIEKEIEIKITHRRTVNVDIALDYESLEGEEVSITAQAEGQYKAINKQLSADQIVNAISDVRIQELPDANVAESISRLPGISVTRSSGEAQGIVVRGMSPKFNQVQINGVVMATASDDRGVDLAGISSENLAGVEVYKAITPDMDANIIGGTINLQLAKAKDIPSYSIRLYNSYNELERDFKQYKVFGRLSRRLFKNQIGVQAAIHSESINRGRDYVSASYTIWDKPDGSTDYILNNVSMTDRRQRNIRHNGSFILDYAIGSNEFMLSNFVTFGNTQTKSITRKVAPSVMDDLDKTEGKNWIVMNALKGKHSILNLVLDWGLSHSYSLSDNPYNMSFTFDEMNIDSDGFRSVPLDILPAEYMSRIPVDSSAIFYKVGKSWSKIWERRYASQVNFKMPLAVGSNVLGDLKFGFKFTHIERKNDHGRGSLLRPGTPGLSFTRDYIDPDYDPNPMLDGKSQLGIVYDIDRLIDYVDPYVKAESYPGGHFDLSSPMTGSNNRYNTDHNTYAAYIMTKLNFLGNLVNFIPGVRFESDDNKDTGYYRDIIYHSNEVYIGDYFLQTAHRQWQYWLPMAHLKVKPLEWFDIRLAATKTLARPNFMWRVPYETRNSENSQAGFSMGNPNLKTTESTNYDAYFSFYNNFLGLFTFGGFYKEVDNVSYVVTRYVQTRSDAAIFGVDPNNSDNIDRDYTTAINVPRTSYVRGLEVDLQTNMNFLPGLLKNIIIYANYSRIFSDSYLQKYRVERTWDPKTWELTIIYDTGVREGRLPNQADRIANVAVGYDYKGLSLRLSLFHQGRSLAGVGNWYDRDNYVDSFSRIDFSLRQRFGSHLSFYLAAANMSNEPDIHRASDTPKYGFMEYTGSMYDAGIQYDF